MPREIPADSQETHWQGDLANERSVVFTSREAPSPQLYPLEKACCHHPEVGQASVSGGEKTPDTGQQGSGRSEESKVGRGLGEGQRLGRLGARAETRVQGSVGPGVRTGCGGTCVLSQGAELDLRRPGAALGLPSPRDTLPDSSGHSAQPAPWPESCAATSRSTCVSFSPARLQALGGWAPAGFLQPPTAHQHAAWGGAMIPHSSSGSKPFPHDLLYKPGQVCKPHPALGI